MNDRTVFFLDEELAPAQIFDAPISLEYSEHFCGAGRIKCVVSAASGAAVPQNGFIQCGGLIYAVDSVARDGAAGTLTLCGSGVLALFSRRAVTQDLALNLSPEECVRRLAQTYGAAALPGALEFHCDAQSAAREIVVDAGGVLEEMTRVASSVSKGLRLTFDRARETFVLDMSAGKDRRPGNSGGNEAAVVSESFGTARTVRDSLDRSRYINRVTVIGAEGSDGTAYSVTADARDLTFPDGFDDSAEAVRELIVKYPVPLSLYTHDGGNGLYFDRAGYEAALRERARGELALRRAVRTVSAELVGDTANAVRPGDVCAAVIGDAEPTALRLIERTVRFDGDMHSVTATLVGV